MDTKRYRVIWYDISQEKIRLTYEDFDDKSDADVAYLAHRLTGNEVMMNELKLVQGHVVRAITLARYPRP